MNEPIGIDQAIAEICGVQDSSAFFFVAGAGVSAPAIPTASRMIEDWQMSLEARGNKPVPSTPLKGGLDEYQFWFRKAHPQAKQRQEYLRSRIQTRAVPAAAYALAKILNAGQLGRLVVTTNFDLFISKALGFVGAEPLVYDHPDTAIDRFNPDANHIHVIHVHGTYLYYDCANLLAEINGRAVKTLGLMHWVLASRSPLVFGYSGWEGDVIMTALRDRLYKVNPTTVAGSEWRAYEKALPYNLYWFCYREADLQLLPGWLKQHSSVYFVVPGRSASQTEAVPRPGESLLSLRNSTAVSQAVEPTLPADEVFRRIVENLHIPESAVERDPVTFFIGRLQGLIPGLGPGEVRRIADYTREILPTRIKLDQIRKLLDRREYAQVLPLTRNLVEELKRQGEWDPQSTWELTEAIWKAAFEQPAVTPGVMAAYDDVITLCTCIRDTFEQSACIDERMAKAWATKGLALIDQEQYDSAIAVFDQLLARFPAPSSLALQDTVASSQVNKGIALFRKLRPKQPGDAANTILRYYDSVLESLAGASECALRETLASAMVNKAYLLGAIGQPEDSEALYDLVISDFGDASEPTIREHVARAMINRAFRLGEKREIEQTHHSQDVYRQVTLKFAHASRPSMRTKIALAWNGLGFQSLLLAKYYRSDPARSAGYLQEALDAITKAKELKPDSGMILGNEAYILFLLGDHARARETLAEAIRLGGEETRGGELRDTAIYPIPEDAVFVEWIGAALTLAATV